MKIVTIESLPILADNKTSITRGSAANSQGAKFESPIVLAFANLTAGQSLIWRPTDTWKRRGGGGGGRTSGSICKK